MRWGGGQAMTIGGLLLGMTLPNLLSDEWQHPHVLHPPHSLPPPLPYKMHAAQVVVL